MMPDRVQQDLLASGSSTVMGLFYLRPGDRTLRYATQDKHIPLLQVENNWSLEIAPGPKEKTEHSARLRVRTRGNGQPHDEVLELPPFPKQKWVGLAILREGRRFDVLYNGRIVASQRLENYPVVISSPMTMGNKGVEGTAIHVTASPRRLTPEEVERERLRHVDTNGMPVEAKWSPFSALHALPLPFSLPSLQAQCPPGLPCEGVTQPPRGKSVLYEWNTPYA